MCLWSWLRWSAILLLLGLFFNRSLFPVLWADCISLFWSNIRRFYDSLSSVNFTVLLLGNQDRVFPWNVFCILVTNNSLLFNPRGILCKEALPLWSLFFLFKILFFCKFRVLTIFVKIVHAITLSRKKYYKHTSIALVSPILYLLIADNLLVSRDRIVSIILEAGDGASATVCILHMQIEPTWQWSLRTASTSSGWQTNWAVAPFPGQKGSNLDDLCYVSSLKVVNWTLMSGTSINFGPQHSRTGISQGPCSGFRLPPHLLLLCFTGPF